MTRSSRRWLLRWQERRDALPFGVAQRPVDRREWWHATNATAAMLGQRTAGGVTARSHHLVRPAPVRPGQSERSTRLVSCHREDQAAGFRYGEWDQAGIIAPFSTVSSRQAAWRMTIRKACATRQRVMKRCHAVQVRTSY